MRPSRKIKADIFKSEREEAFDSPLNSYEKAMFVILLLMLTMILTVAAWSGILLLFGQIEGGGPLGLFMEEVLINLLLNRWL